EGLRTAEIDGVGLDEIGIQLVLADQLAQAVAHLRSTVICVVPIDRSGRELFRLAGGRNRFGERADLLHRADADAIGFAQGTIDCPGFRHPQLRTLYQRGYIRWVCITIAHEASAGFRLEYGRLKGKPM